LVFKGCQGYEGYWSLSFVVLLHLPHVSEKYATLMVKATLN